MPRDYYEVLGVAKNADDGQIKSAYRKLAMQFHPDRNPGDQAAEEKFKEAAEAYEVLRDPQKRSAYDRYGHDGLKSSGFSGFGDVRDIYAQFGDVFGDLFGSFFSGGGLGGMFGQGGRGGRQRGDDLRVDANLTFREAAFGCQKTLTVPRTVACEACSGSGAKAGTEPQACGTCRGRGQVVHAQGGFMIATTCPTCRGQGQVIKERCPECRGQGARQITEDVEIEVPAGVDDGLRMRVPGKGAAGARGGPAGSLYVDFHVEPDPLFKREGEHLYCEVPIGLVQAILGGEVKLPLLDGTEHTLKIARGTQPGTVQVVRGAGVARLESSGRGDLAVELKVVIPTDLNAEQEQLLQAFAASGGDRAGEAQAVGSTPGEEKEGFWSKLSGNKKKKRK
jgi:molecular chaperone DnaJ